jgi:squalene synthase HpnC
MTVDALRAEADARLPHESAILPLAAAENFSVAPLLVGRETCSHLTAIYGFARLADQLGDEVAGDRLALLDELERELGRAYDGTATHPLLRRVAVSARACDLPRGPFLRLIEANRLDQRQARYATFEDLLAYCDLSANPVGELVLHVFDAATPERITLSDKVCSALQLAEHWQDVGEDFRRGRVYLPTEDRVRFDVAEDELGATRTSDGLKRLLSFEVGRARSLLDEGAPLVGLLRGRARFAVAGYAGGGRAALDAVTAADCEVLAGAPRPGRLRRALAVLRTYGAGS